MRRPRRPLAVLAALFGVACSLNVGEHGGPCGEDAHTGTVPQQLVFVSDAVFGQYDICLINTNGTAATQLTTSLSDDWWPSWSPDGSKIVFMTNRNLTPGDTIPAHPQYDLYVINVDGSGETRITTDTTNEAQPAWSPLGNRIAFVSDRDGNNEIYLMNPDGGAVTRLTNDSASDEQPAWSPDGTKVVFVSFRTGNAEIFVMDTTGANLVNLTNNGAADFVPAWSPDGTKIAFHSNRAGNFAVFVMNADGSNVVQLTNAAVPDELPAWSPDGTHLIFDTDGELWIMTAAGAGATQVTHSRFVHDFMARWRP